MNKGDRLLLVDASVFITLSRVGAVELLSLLRGDVVVPDPVKDEITSSPADEWLEAGVYNGWIEQQSQFLMEDAELARNYLGYSENELDGDVALLACALGVESGEISPNEAKEKVYAMDEVGARLSASLVKRAEKLIDDTAD